MHYFLRFCILTFFILAIFPSCGHKDIIPQIVPVTPSILIKQQMPSSKDAFAEGTMMMDDFGYVGVNISSNQYYETYEWKIAADPRFAAIKQPTLSLFF
jgi:hypothetical protein